MQINPKENLLAQLPVHIQITIGKMYLKKLLIIHTKTEPADEYNPNDSNITLPGIAQQYVQAIDEQTTVNLINEGYNYDGMTQENYNHRKYMLSKPLIIKQYNDRTIAYNHHEIFYHDKGQSSAQRIYHARPPRKKLTSLHIGAHNNQTIKEFNYSKNFEYVTYIPCLRTLAIREESTLGFPPILIKLKNPPGEWPEQNPLVEAFNILTVCKNLSSVQQSG